MLRELLIVIAKYYPFSLLFVIFMRSLYSETVANSTGNFLINLVVRFVDDVYEFGKYVAIPIAFMTYFAWRA